MNVIFLTGNGYLTGELIGDFDLNGETFFRIRDMFGETRALRASEFSFI